MAAAAAGDGTVFIEKGTVLNEEADIPRAIATNVDHLLRSRTIVRFPMPSSPHGPSGVSNAQGVMGPPSRFDTHGTRRPPRETDYICPPSHILLTVKPKSERKLNDQGIPLSAKRQRRGDVPRLMANFFEIAFKESDNDCDIEFFGVSHEGVTDYKAAKKYPDSAGRVTAAVQGAVTIFCDHRHLTTAEPGDVLEYIPVDSGLRWTDGHSQFAPCIVQKYSGPKRGVTSSSDVTQELKNVLLKINEKNRLFFSNESDEFVRTKLTKMFEEESPENISQYILGGNFAKDLLKEISALYEPGNGTFVTREAIVNELTVFAILVIGSFLETPDSNFKEFEKEVQKVLKETVQEDEKMRKAVEIYVDAVLNDAFGKDAQVLRVASLTSEKEGDSRSLIYIMCLSVVEGLRYFALGKNSTDTPSLKTISFGKRPTPSKMTKELKKLLKVSGVSKDQVEALSDSIKTFDNEEVMNTVFKEYDENSGPYLYNPEVFIDALGEPESDIIEDHRFQPMVYNYLMSTPSSVYDRLFSIRMTFGLPVLAAAELTKSTKISLRSYVPFGSDFTIPDLTSPTYPVYDPEHEALVLKARMLIDEHTKIHGEPPTISYGTSGHFVDEKPSQNRNPIGTTRNRCFATLIEKGIGAYKNEIRVYLNPALRAL